MCVCDIKKIFAILKVIKILQDTVILPNLHFPSLLVFYRLVFPQEIII